MVVTTHNKFQLIDRNIDSFEEGRYHKSVVFRTFFNQFDGRFEGVKEGMDISEKYLDFTTGAKEMSELDLSSTVSPNFELCPV